MSKAQKEKVANFISFVGGGANEKTATKKLKGCNWNLEQAVEEYLLENGDADHTAKVDQAKLTELFNKYKDKVEDAILIEGLEQFCNDLAIDPMDIVLLVIAHALAADRSCVFTRQQFIEGFTKLGYDTIDKIKAALPSLRGLLNEPEKFREVYIFSFNYNKEPAQKSLPLEVAIPLWKLLLQTKFAKLDDWCDFVQVGLPSFLPSSFFSLSDFNQRNLKKKES